MSKPEKKTLRENVKPLKKEPAYLKALAIRVKGKGKNT
ncbi:hypothetical protein EDF68_104135 [Ochrobactrum sp. BH3]|nr:hypothetical protein EDF68_104135 [Ochrobactrum sp. BH3]